MRNFTLTFLFAFSLATLAAQTIVPTMPMNRNVVLEEYTGVNCQWCPDGHRVANIIKATNPTRVNLINIHQGSFSTPSAGQPDYRTTWGNALAGQTALTGYPCGTINRQVFSGSMTPGGTALGRGVWSSSSNTVMGQASYANMAATATIDMVTRLLTVYVEVYYTANGPAQNNINVALLQNNIIGPQVGASLNPSYVVPGGYRHMHMLRHLLTGQWGDPILKTNAGMFVPRTYTYPLPTHITNVSLELSDLEVIVSLAEGQQMIITGNEAALSYINVPFQYDAAIAMKQVPAETCLGTFAPEIVLKNEGSTTLTSIEIEYSTNGGPFQTYIWTGSLPFLASANVTLPLVTLLLAGTNTIQKNIVKVNGVIDQNPANNTVSISAPNTTRISTGKTHTLKFRQDRYGTETTWKLVVEATGLVVASGGPYANLPANGILEHTINLTLPSGGCYNMQVSDSYGDGMNSGAGAGGYTLLDENGTIILFNGVFTSFDSKLFVLTSATGIEKPSFALVTTYPNPANNILYLSNVEGVNVLQIYNLLGQPVKSIMDFDTAAGQNGIHVGDLPNGVYIVKLSGNNRESTARLIISK